jgi:hypothetical protein
MAFISLAASSGFERRAFGLSSRPVPVLYFNRAAHSAGADGRTAIELYPARLFLLFTTALPGALTCHLLRGFWPAAEFGQFYCWSFIFGIVLDSESSPTEISRRLKGVKKKGCLCGLNSAS